MRQPPWFMASAGDWQGDAITLTGDEAHHAVHVMRVSVPDVVTVTDGSGRVARAAVRETRPHEVVLEVLESEVRRPLRPQIAVYQAAAKGHKNDEVVSKLAELGVAAVYLFTSARSVSRWDGAKAERLAARWRDLARSAAKQSRNPYVADTGYVGTWDEVRERVAAEPLAVTLWEEASLPLRTVLAGDTPRLALVVGPEGGLTPEEAEALADAGAQPASLGPLILRTENAALVAASGILFHYGLIG